MSDTQLQRGFSETYRDAVFDAESRRRKARKAVAVLKDCLPFPETLRLLEIGCAAGFGTVVYAEAFHAVSAIDIDEPAIAYAKDNNDNERACYAVMDSQRTGFADGSFDAVVCTHVYEHVPDAKRLMAEIYRVLRPGGVCFFSAGNRIALVEPHYRLPLLSVIPKFTAHWYLRLLNRGTFYYENHLTYWGLRRLVCDFELEDYTLRVTQDPARFEATDVLPPGSVKQKVAHRVLRVAYWLCPTYLWILRKPVISVPMK